MNHGRNAPWPEANVLILRRLWQEGLSASKIAKEMNKPPINAGLTRNAVIAKVHRLGLAARATPSNGSARSLANGVRNGALSAQGSAPIYVIDRSRERGAARGDWNVRFADKEDWQCLMFVGGESHDTGLICGAEREEGKPYCSNCKRIAYLPPEMKRRVA